MSYYVLKHSAKGTTWGEHKYIRKEGNRYIYPEDVKKSANDNNVSDDEEIDKLLDEIENACPLLDGMLEGKIIFSKGSTIVDCTSNEIKILRSGPISYEEILKLLNK